MSKWILWSKMWKRYSFDTLFNSIVLLYFTLFQSTDRNHVHLKIHVWTKPNVLQQNPVHNAFVKKALRESYVKRVSFVSSDKEHCHLDHFLVQRSSNAKYCPLNCQAGGTCVYVKSTPKCRCPKGRTGRLCESRMSKTTATTFSNLSLLVGSGKSLSIDEDEMDM